MISKKLVICFVALVLLPLGLLAWMGVRASANDEMRVRQQLRDVLLGRLRDTRGRLGQAIEQVGRELQQKFEQWEQLQKSPATPKKLALVSNRKNRRTRRRKRRVRRHRQVKRKKRVRQGKLGSLLGALWRRKSNVVRKQSAPTTRPSPREKVVQTKQPQGAQVPPVPQQSARQSRDQRRLSAAKAKRKKQEKLRAYLRKLRRDVPIVRQAFWLDRKGQMLYPDPTLSKSVLYASEWSFLQRTKAIWERRAILSQPRRSSPLLEPRNLGSNPKKPPARRSVKQASNANVGSASSSSLGQNSSSLMLNNYQNSGSYSSNQRLLSNSSSYAMLQRLAAPKKQRSKGDSLINLASDREHGWLVWYWAEGLHLLFWKRQSDGGIVGVEVDRIVLMSRLIGVLPGTSSDERQRSERILLVDGKNAPIYQWGAYKAPAKEAPLARVYLSYPLHTWRLVYFGPERQQFSLLARRLHVQMLALISIVGLILILIALYLYREYSRDMRDAAQRVTFVTQVSHELKTPLTNIRLYAELLEARLPEEEPRSRRHVGVIVSESQRLSRLINNILTFARQRRNKLKLRPTAMQIDPLIGRIIEQFRPNLESSGFVIEETSEAPLPTMADTDALEQILGNLISNVKKYASGGQWLGIRSWQDDAGTHIEVRDRGAGIPEDMRQDIFQPFVRCSDKLSEGVSGTGIGLTIARELAWMQDGELSLVTSGEDGSCFRLTLPTQEASA